MKILVTGFTPFGGETINPSREAVRALDDSIAGADIIKCEIPTEFEASIDAPGCNQRTSAECHPLVSDSSAAVHPFRSNASPSICGTPAPPITQASSRTTSRLLAARLTPFFSTIPTRQITDRLRAAGIPAALSYSAGTYVCNNLLYAALYESSQAEKGNSARCGFIHVPYLPDQAAAAVSNAPSMSLELMVQALTIAAGTIVECR